MAKNQADVVSRVAEMRNQGLSDNIIAEELKNSGYDYNEVNQALMQTDYPPADFSAAFPSSAPMMPPARAYPEEGGVYERMEEIAENLVDEKWEQLIGEVKKIIDWKERMEEEISQIHNDLEKAKEDFKLLHQGVLGKLEDYDTRMRDVGTELKAVGKVFKEVIPEFVENVKELKSITEKRK